MTDNKSVLNSPLEWPDMLQQVFQLLKLGKLCDVTLCFPDESSDNAYCTIHAHKLILASTSQYFKELLLENGLNDTVYLADVPSAIMAKLIGLMYGQTISMTPDDVTPLYQAAKLLKVYPVCEALKALGTKEQGQIADDNNDESIEDVIQTKKDSHTDTHSSFDDALHSCQFDQTEDMHIDTTTTLFAADKITPTAPFTRTQTLSHQNDNHNSTYHTKKVSNTLTSSASVNKTLVNDTLVCTSTLVHPTHIDTKRMTSTHIDTKRMTSTHIDTKRMTPSQEIQLVNWNSDVLNNALNNSMNYSMNSKSDVKFTIKEQLASVNGSLGRSNDQTSACLPLQTSSEEQSEYVSLENKTSNQQTDFINPLLRRSKRLIEIGRNDAIDDLDLDNNIDSLANHSLRRNKRQKFRNGTENYDDGDELKDECHDDKTTGHDEVIVNRYSSLTFICNKCAWHGQLKMDYLCHSALEHSLGDKFTSDQTCKYCEKFFEFKVLYKQHVDKDHRKKHWVCHGDNCDTITTSRFMYDKHILKDHKTKAKCPVCFQTFTTLKDMRKHLRISHQKNGKLKCPKCPKTFSKVPGLQGHMTKEHNILENERKVCDYHNCKFSTLDPQVFKCHKEKHETIVSHHCEQCSKTFTSVRNLKRHILYWHKRNTGQCKTCGKHIHGPANQIAVHEKSCGPQGAKDFACDQCKFQTATLSSLNNHIFTKHGVTPEKTEVLICSICGYQTIRNSILNQHMLRKHGGERKYSCQLCNKSYLQKGELERHISYSHAEKKPFMCSICAYTAKTQQYLKQHIRLQHSHPGVKPYKCAYCPHASALKSNCRKHIQREHIGFQVQIDQLFHIEENTTV
ncbi:unnamed protein product [Owenia fusiformis]|uniref:Uncharacterized protein n=1 Tax=Owenia fusiformis TaxID=6347 RepID=A0A8S4PWC7_OWEFU|nr:unnamed protein product [Owenia fusiformis]